MNPREGMMRQFAEIQDVFQLGGFHRQGFDDPRLNDIRAKQARNFAAAQVFDGFAKQIANEPKLAAGALRGSVEAQSIINRNRVGGDNRKVEDILKQIEKRMEEQNRRAQQIGEALDKAGFFKVK
jgi:hypothetical protein